VTIVGRIGDVTRPGREADALRGIAPSSSRSRRGSRRGIGAVDECAAAGVEPDAFNYGTIQFGTRDRIATL
jgi:hypothetical protein